MNDAFDLTKPGVWFGSSTCSLRFPDNSDWRDLAEACSQFKKGNFHLRSELADRVYQFQDIEARRVAIFLLMCVADHATLEDIERTANEFSIEDALDFAALSLYSLSPVSSRIVKALAEKFQDHESYGVMKHFSDEITRGFTGEKGLFHAYFWNSKPAFVGDFCLELQAEMKRCRVSNDYFRRVDLATLLSVASGELVPVNFGQAIELSDVEKIIDYVKRIASSQTKWMRAHKYFYGFRVSYDATR